MPGPVLAVGAAILCPHGGTGAIVGGSARVTAAGLPIALLGDRVAVAGCTHIVDSVPQPCIAIEWLTSAKRVLVDGRPPVLQTDAALALDARKVPAGAPLIAANQSRVIMV